MVNAIISKNIRIRHPDDFSVGHYSIVDDFCYFSTRVLIGRCSHIAAGCTIAGGGARTFRLGDYCSLSSGVRVWCTSDDFSNDLVTVIPEGVDAVKTHLITGDVTFANYTAAGANAVIMPDNLIPEGTVIGALSFVPARMALLPWSVYAGVPVRLIRPRNRLNVLAQVARLDEALAHRED